MTTAPRTEPLYAQVRTALIERMASGSLRPGQVLPSEFALAEELNVSQGTVRKALDTLVADNLVQRRQGRGTFVAEHTQERALFHFFRMEGIGGMPAIPQTLTEEITQRAAPARIATRLGIDKSADVVLIRRTRTLLGKPATFEDIYVPHALLPIRATDGPLPNALYTHYQSAHGLSVARAEDRLSAVQAPAKVVKALPQAEGQAMLLATRVAFDLTDRIIETRESYILTTDTAYAVTLR
ncbi:GntR family transcriptional regulator [Rubricella aquisinus]|uniref:GntR family transcriptional regulator n=1 Tax=Rubricella aquisinus TaxID=2028108 RepID=A0A840X1W1_9RHOB|nr:GntR family transcriptional regulator [Rubricella aquisinus]MBB5514657.1 GntR family transcriptional regulator [Rubricella aquisinus]